MTFQHGAIIRQKTDFGDATGLGKISGEYFSPQHEHTPVINHMIEMVKE